MEKPESSTEGAPNVDTPRPGSSNGLLAWVILLSLGVALGYTTILAKVIVAGGAHPFGVAVWTSALGAGFLLIVNTTRRHPLSFKRDVVWLYVVCGLLGVVIPAISFYYAAIRLPAGVLAITVTVGPILTFLFSVLFGLERFASIRVLGVLFGVLAVALLVVPETSLPDPSAAPWVLLACVPGFCYALENMILTLYLPDGVNPFMITCGNYIVSSIVLLLVVVATGNYVPLDRPWGAIEWSIVAMAVISAVGYSLFIHLISRAGPVFATQVSYLVAISGVVWGIVIFDEYHSIWIWLSLASILTGLTLVRPRQHKKTSE